MPDREPPSSDDLIREAWSELGAVPDPDEAPPAEPTAPAQATTTDTPDTPDNAGAPAASATEAAEATEAAGADATAEPVSDMVAVQQGVDEFFGKLVGIIAPYLFSLGDRTAVVTYLRDLREPEIVRAALADLDGVHLLDQRTFVNDVYREFRQTTLRQMLVGGVLVVLLPVTL